MFCVDPMFIRCSLMAPHAAYEIRYGTNCVVQGTSSDLQLAIEEVSSKIPTVSWETTANAMKASLTLMLQGERSVDVVAFAKECMYQGELQWEWVGSVG